MMQTGCSLSPMLMRAASSTFSQAEDTVEGEEPEAAWRVLSLLPVAERPERNAPFTGSLGLREAEATAERFEALGDSCWQDL